MARDLTLAEQVRLKESRGAHRVQRLVANRTTFNSLSMWVLVGIVWAIAAVMLAASLGRIR